MMQRSGGARARVCVSAALVLLSAAALAHGVAADKRAEMSPAPFVMGSRYGRSPPRLLAPRNDRFFMGSRYGKRSEGGGGGGGGAVVTSRAPALLCEYTGVYPLYRCVVRGNERHHYHKSSPNEASRSGKQ